jgi:predicted RND superfamily exporter protein
MNLHGGDPSWYRLPESQEQAAQYLLLYEMSVPYGLDVNTEVDIDKSKLRVTVSFETMSSRELVRMNDAAEAWAKENSPNIDTVTGTGIAVMFARISAVNMRAMLKGTVVALLGISIILIVAFRSLRLGFLSLIPNLFPLGISFGLWGYFVGQIGLSLSVVSSMTLGIIVDDTVHFISKYNDATRSGLVGLEAIRYTYESVGQALIVTSISLICGFLVLTLSPFYLNASLGLLAAIVILVALICDLVLLPSLLLLRPDNKRAADLT